MAKWFIEKYNICVELKERLLSNKIGYRIKICTGDTYKFLDLIRPYIPSMFYYKVNYEKSEDFDVYGENIPPDKLALAFQQHWDKLNTRYGVQLEEYLARYVTNCLQREWFVSLPDPFVYIHMLTIRIAVLRFLITSHPNIISLLDNDVSIDEFNKKIVEVIYLYARSIDHNHAFLHVIFQAIYEQQMMSFDYSMAFIKI